MSERPDKRRCPGRTTQGIHKSTSANGSLTSLGQTADHFVKRLLQDCLAEATAAYWLRRADTFEAVGTAACDEIARACRNHASLAPFEDHRDVVTALLQEVSA